MRDDWPRTGPTDENAVAEGCYFDDSAAERVKKFAALCCHNKGRWAGEPFEFLPPLWEKWIRPLYGWRRADGSRRFRETFCFLPKKTGKSTTASVLSQYHLHADKEPAPEVYSVAKNRQQAGIVFREAAMMVASSPVLKRITHIAESRKTMTAPNCQGVFRCLSADAGSQEGLNISALIRDELHALRDRKLYDALRYGGAARHQPLFIDITTAGDDKESVCYQVYSYAKKVLSGEEKDWAFLPVIFEAPEGADLDNPATWAAANPGIGLTLSEETIRAEWRRARQSPDDWASWCRYRLNQWVETVTAWLSMEKWDACGADPTFQPGKVVYGGLDLSATIDLTSFVLWEPDTGSVLPFFWIPSEAFKDRERKNKRRIDGWGATRHIRVIPGARIDHEIVFKDICEIVKKYRVTRIGADPYNAIPLLMRLDKLPGLKVRPVRQGMLSLSPPTKLLEGLILDRKIRHGAHPVLRWNFESVAIKTDESDNKRPVKDRCADKIDGIMALLFAIAVWQVEGDTRSIYELGAKL